MPDLHQLLVEVRDALVAKGVTYTNVYISDDLFNRICDAAEELEHAQ